MKRFLSFFLCISSIFFLHGCYRYDLITETILTGKISLENVVELNIPDGCFEQAQKVSILKKSEDAYFDDFEQTAFFLTSVPSVSYFVKITLETLPLTDNILATLIVPADYASQFNSDYSFVLYAKIYQNSGEEVLDNYQLIESSYDDANNTITAYIPRYLFAMREGSNYEVLLTIAAKENFSSSTKATSTSGTDKCDAIGVSSPLKEYYVTSGFGLRDKNGKPVPHYGIDLRASVGTEVYAMADGQVNCVTVQRKVTNDATGKEVVSGWGLYVLLAHPTNIAEGPTAFYTLYAHLSSTKTGIERGVKVKKGDVIGYSGGDKSDSPNAGGSEAPHLHIEYIPGSAFNNDSKRINPDPCISQVTDGSILIADNGNWADDSFAAYWEGIHLGTTGYGQNQRLTVSNVKPGKYQLSVKFVSSTSYQGNPPDDLGTLGVVLKDGLLFENGGASKSASIYGVGNSVSYVVVVPATITKSCPCVFDDLLKMMPIVDEGEINSKK